MKKPVAVLGLQLDYPLRKTWQHDEQ